MHILEWKCTNFDQDFTEVIPKRPIKNIPALAQTMAKHRPDDKPFPESMMVS